MSLQNAPLVMVWREVSDLSHAESIASRTLGWPEIGRNDYAVMYDAGTLIAAYWARPKFQKAALVAPVVAPDCCDTALVSTPAHNPASEFLVLARDFSKTANLVGAAMRRPSVSVAGQGDTISVVDRDGNYAACLSPHHPLAGVKDSGTLFRSVGGTSSSSHANPYVAHKFLVSDLERSIQYYQSVLGLELIRRGSEQAIFNCGAAMLVCQLESASGLVDSLARAGRLASDGLVFYAENIERVAESLAKAGAKSSQGVQYTAHGPGAEFFDPDGHKFGIWSRPADPGGINYFPTLDRILAQTPVAV